MDVFEAIETRRSVRRFLPEPVPREVLERCIEAAGKAPSPHNEQMWRFVAVTDRALIRRMAEAVKEEVDRLAGDDREGAARVKWFGAFFGHAPAVVLVFMRPIGSVVASLLPGTGEYPELKAEMETTPARLGMGAAVENFLLAAVALGYGTCWLSAPVVAAGRLAELAGVGEPWRFVSLIAMGKPRRETAGPPKKPLEEIAEFREPPSSSPATTP